MSEAMGRQREEWLSLVDALNARIHIYDRFNEGCHQEIADYCLQDVELTREIYYMLTFDKSARAADEGRQ
jgi:hypothetical protein